MRWWLVALGAVGLLTAFAQSRFVTQPGYMDACYAYNGGYAIAAGQGWNDSYLWNYLDDPTTIPHPAHTYWMPLPSFVAALGLWLGGLTFRGAQVPFIILAAALPPLAGLAGWVLTRDDRRALLAGLLAAFTGFYTAYTTTTDGFPLYALIATGVFLLTGEALAQRRADLWLAVGGLLGFAHLTRADGLLLLAVVLAFVWAQVPRRNPSDPPAVMPRRAAGSRVVAVGLILVGYLAISGIWFVRNQLILGTLFPGGGLRTLWLTEYDEFFHYPASDLGLPHLLASGWPAVLRARGAALLENLQTMAVVQGWVVLAPFVLAGLWHLRSRRDVQLAVGYLIALFAAMTLAFPWPGARGGYFHSSAAFIPFLAAAASVGIGRSVQWVANRRGWVLSQATAVFDGAAVVLAVGVTVFLFAGRVIGTGQGGVAWSRQDHAYAEAGTLIRADGSPAPVVAVNNPPCFYYQAMLPAVVIPHGGPSALEAVVRRYGVTHVIVDRNLPNDLAPSFEGEKALTWLEPVSAIADESGASLRIYRVRLP